jgi:hypothetical protein
MSTPLVSAAGMDNSTGKKMGMLQTLSLIS